MEYPESTFARFEELTSGSSPLEVFEGPNGSSVSWYECCDLIQEDVKNFKLNISNDGYVRIDTNNAGNITRVEDEFINLPDNEMEMGWY